MSDTDETEGPQATVFEDGVRDLLTGSEAVNRFIVNDADDKVTDRSADEFADALEFTLAEV